MLEYAYYSVITPEGCATILWKGAEHAPRAAEALKMTSRDLKRLGVIDAIVPEPPGGAHRDHRQAASNLKTYILRALRELRELPIDVLLERRYQKFRAMGCFTEQVDPPDVPASANVGAPGATPTPAEPSSASVNPSAV
jgi:acetyl-CoA carboxylase carboxyl transferase subunit alpha